MSYGSRRVVVVLYCILQIILDLHNNCAFIKIASLKKKRR
jgi:hypothetical protein